MACASTSHTPVSETSKATQASNTFYASPNGKRRGNGSKKNPWNLVTAFNHPQNIKPGDTLILLPGLYTGDFICHLQGTPQKPIAILGNGKATLDGNTGVRSKATLKIKGRYAIYSGIEITNSSRKRIQDSIPAERGITTLGKAGVYITTPFNTFNNLVIHDNPGNGMSLWSGAFGSSVNGCVIYYNGFEGKTRGQGHGIYSQNDSTTITLSSNIVFSNFSYGIHIYGKNGPLENYIIQDNTLFNNGIICKGSKFRPNILVGGSKRADNISIRNNCTYTDYDKPGFNLKLGYSDLQNGSVEVLDNYLVGGSPLLQMQDWDTIVFTNNSLISGFALVDYDQEDMETHQWDGNHFHTTNVTPFNKQDFASWDTNHPSDDNSSFSKLKPQENKVFIKQASEFLIITVYNWSNIPSWPLDMNQHLTPGERYEIWDVQKGLVNPVVQGRFNGTPVPLPLQLTEIAKPTGIVPVIPTHTAPLFACFLVHKLP